MHVQTKLKLLDCGYSYLIFRGPHCVMWWDAAVAIFPSQTRCYLCSRMSAQIPCVCVLFFFISAMQRQRPAELAECAPQHICIIISVWALVWHNPIHICTLRACLYFTISAHAVPLHLCSVWFLPCASPPYPQPSLQSAHRRQHRNNKFRGHAIDNWPDK